jgi:hypothetical protein
VCLITRSASEPQLYVISGARSLITAASSRAGDQ